MTQALHLVFWLAWFCDNEQRGMTDYAKLIMLLLFF